MKEQALKIDDPFIKKENKKHLNDTRICYWKDEDGMWWIYLPYCGAGILSKHEVTEHEDGTITVRPSILMYVHNNEAPSQRHGYLNRGEWQEC